MQLFSENGEGNLDLRAVLEGRSQMEAPGVYGPLRVAVEPPEGNVVISLRDPRDVLVSMFFAYCYSHPGPVAGGTGHRADVAAEGIDSFVLTMATTEDFPYIGAYGTGSPLWPFAGNVRRRHEQLLDLAESPSATLLSYEAMVGDFAGWVRALGRELGVVDEGALAAVADELGIFEPRGERSHRRNVRPGDHREKLRPETIGRLDEVFAVYFERLRGLRSRLSASNLRL